MSLSNLSISAKLFVLAGALVTGLLAVGGYGLQAVSQAQERQHAALERKRAVLEAVDLARGTEVAFKLQVQEWKDILIRGHDPADQERYLAAFRKAADKTVASLEKVERAVSGLGLSTDEVQEARRMHAALLRDYLNAFQQYSTERIDSTQTVDRLVRGKDRPLDAAIEKVVTGIGRFAVQDSEQLTAAAAADTRRAVVAMLIVIALVLAIAASLALWVGRDIARPLREAVVAAQQVAGGDLTVQLRTGRRDEVGQMLMAFAAMTASLEALIREVGTGSLAVAESSAQIAQGHIDLSQRTEEQAATLEETASQMEELTTTVLQNADHARQAGEFASGAAVVARKGGDEVSRVVSTMAEISEASRRIHEITSLIDDIAFQTNILALNAAVEAARAGEQGRGFAVVAAEVRSLAQRSATAAREIKGLVGASVDKVDAGTKLADSAGRTIQEVTDSVRRMADLVQDIAAASREQGVGIEQVNTAVTQMDQVVQQNAALVEEAAAATESMKEQAASLLAVISRFKLRDLHGGARVAPVQAAPSRGAPGSIPALAGAGGWPDLI